MRAARAAVVLVTLAAGAATATARAVDVGFSPMQILNVEITPRKLSPTHPTHVRMSLSGSYQTSDGSHLPALRELKLEGDRHLRLDLKGEPVCRGAHYDYRGALEDFCGDAVIGHGELTVEVVFPEEPPMTVTGELSLYNFGRLGRERRLLANASFPAPVTGEIPVSITIRRIDKGRYGWRATASVPKIAGGAGSITGYSVRIGKRFLTATCAGGWLQLRAVSNLFDGTTLTGSFIHPCTVSEPHVRQ